MESFIRELQVPPMPEFLDAPEADVRARFERIARLTTVAWNVPINGHAAIRRRIHRLLNKEIPHIHS